MDYMPHYFRFHLQKYLFFFLQTNMEDQDFFLHLYLGGNIELNIPDY